ncbi:MAG TPA: HPF/RaiA family ribosome-associated protein [Pseudomonadales bacterium]|nr:HPF/RaiA family ribosome-associated protein [Pseudomonadales bacterium]
MQIQLNTDGRINGTEALAAKVRAMVEPALAHFSSHITRVEVHLSDENSRKHGQHDHRCMLEARLEGLQPVAVTEHAMTLEQAVQGAGKKLVRLLDSKIGRLQDQRERPSALPELDEPDQLDEPDDPESLQA